VLIRLGDVRREPGAQAIWSTSIDGRAVVVDRGPSGSLGLRFGDEASFRVEPDGWTITCAPRADAEPARWQRFLLDTVLWSAALVQGRVALHAATIADGDGAVAILGGTGAGKTSVAVALLRRGGALVSDDVLVVSSGARGVRAHPAPPVMNLDAAADPDLRASVGRLLARLDDEDWICVHAPVPAPVPLRAVVVLDRAHPGSQPELHETPQDVLALEARSISLPGLPRAYARTRFEVLADVAARVPVLALSVPRSFTPDAIADVLRATLPPTVRMVA